MVWPNIAHASDQCIVTVMLVHFWQNYLFSSVATNWFDLYWSIASHAVKNKKNFYGIQVNFTNYWSGNKASGLGNYLDMQS